MTVLHVPVNWGNASCTAGIIMQSDSVGGGGFIKYAPRRKPF